MHRINYFFTFIVLTFMVVIQPTFAGDKVRLDGSTFTFKQEFSKANCPPAKDTNVAHYTLGNGTRSCDQDGTSPALTEYLNIVSFCFVITDKTIEKNKVCTVSKVETPTGYAYFKGRWDRNIMDIKFTDPAACPEVKCFPADLNHLMGITEYSLNAKDLQEIFGISITVEQKK